MTGADMSGRPMTGTAPSWVEADEVAALRRLAERLARQAGELVQRDRPDRVAVAGTKSSSTDMVTAMDRASEQLLSAQLLQLRANDGLLGEEGAGRVGTTGLTWVVDPIDGTVNYAYGLPIYAVSVAVVTGDVTTVGAWSPLAGCVHNPASGQTWTAAAGQGATLDGVPTAAPPAPTADQALVGTGFGYQPAQRRRQAAVMAALLPQVRDVRRLGSAAIDLCLVASGRLDAYYEQGLNAWDMAAGMLVARESGVTVTGLAGRPPGDRLVLAARQPLHGVLAELLQNLDADTREGDALVV
jgi:myo-inositol-1(or 4)-monophosphatase